MLDVADAAGFAGEGALAAAGVDVGAGFTAVLVGAAVPGALEFVVGPPLLARG